VTESAPTLALVGAGCFGAVVGWYVYYVNRYRRANVQLADVVTVVAAVGGGAILSLFPAETELFGAYGIGLFAGFFGYLVVLFVLVQLTPNFGVDWFLDGRRRRPAGDWYVPEESAPTARAMGGGESEGIG
jgi:hypothetical protein